jgi:predicted TIM-barrel fold metal-dependent hydrolase
MRKPSDDDHALLPFPVAPVSNGEWCPLPITDRQRRLANLVIEETSARAKRHGMTRGQFLRTAAATLTTFMCINKVYGYDQDGDNAMLPVRKEQCDDLDAARELLDKKQTFIMDVQQHHVDLQRYGDTDIFCFLDFINAPGTVCPESIGQLAYVREVFINSETTVGVISGLPGGLPLGPAAMAQTRDLVNQLAGSERALSQAVCDPQAAPGTSTAIDQMEHHIRDLNARALKCYTYSGTGWRLDDEDGTRMLEEATRLGITLTNTHKGLPAIFAPGSPQTVRTIDYPQALKNFPKMKFCAYHSGYFQGDTHPEGKTDITEFIEVLQGLSKKERKRMYAEIGSTFGITFTADQGDAPGQEKYRSAHLLGKLLKTLGSRNILWGTDSVWWGSPQFLIDGFKMLQIPAELQEQFGYPALTDKMKKRIFGENAAKLYRVKPKAPRCTIPLDSLEQAQQAMGGPRGAATLRWYGPQTRRGFFALLRNEWTPRV